MENSKERIFSAALAEEKKFEREKFDAHLKIIQNERRLMHQRMNECRSNPKRMLIYMDTMDQDKTDIPRFSTF